MNLAKDDDAFLTGHNIDGRILFPAAGFMTLVWRTFAKTKNSAYEKTPVVMEDVVFHRPIFLPKDGSVKFGINFFNGSGRFEICESQSLVVSGVIYIPENIELEQLPFEPLEQDLSGLLLKTNDIYKELRLRGYEYSGIFRGITQSDSKAVTGKLKWQENWVSFIDTMLQFSVLSKNFRELYLPVRIERASFNPMKHLEIAVDSKQSEADVPVYMYKDVNIIKSGGIELRGVKASMATRRSGTQPPPILERYVYVPLNNADHDLSTSPQRARMHAVSVAAHLTIENSGGAVKVKVADVVESKAVDTALAQMIQSIIENEPILASDVVIITNQSIETYAQGDGESGIRVIAKDPSIGPVEANNHLVVAYNVVDRANAHIVLDHLKSSIHEYAFILLEENCIGYDETAARKLFERLNLTIVSIQRSFNTMFILLRPTCNIATRKKTAVFITDKNFSWVDPLKSALATAEKENTYVYIVGQGEELLGAVGLMNCIKHENGGKFARLIFIQDENAEEFSFTSKTYAQQLDKVGWSVDFVFKISQNSYL